MSRHPCRHSPDTTLDCPRCGNNILVREWWTHNCRLATADSEPAKLVLTPPPERPARRPRAQPSPLDVIEAALRQAKRGVACTRCGRLLAAGATCDCVRRGP